jgi:hypothetical protein
LKKTKVELCNWRPTILLQNGTLNNEMRLYVYRIEVGHNRTGKRIPGSRESQLLSTEENLHLDSSEGGMAKNRGISPK